MSTDIFSCHNQGVLPESRGQRPGMLNILKYTGQSPIAMNYPGENGNSAAIEKLVWTNNNG